MPEEMRDRKKQQPGIDFLPHDRYNNRAVPIKVDGFAVFKIKPRGGIMKTEYLVKIGSVAKWLVPFFAAVALLNA